MERQRVYLGWQLTLLPPYEHVKAHITLKYLGEGSFDVRDIARLLRGHELDFALNSYFWSAEKFDTTEHYVMMFFDVNPGLYETRRAVERLRKDDYAVWRPHVTLPKEIWMEIEKHNLLANEVIKNIGPLGLFSSNTQLFLFQDNVTIPDSIRPGRG